MRRGGISAGITVLLACAVASAVPSAATPQVGAVSYRVDSLYSAGALADGGGYFLTIQRAILVGTVGSNAAVAGECLFVDRPSTGVNEVGCKEIDPQSFPFSVANGHAHFDVTVPASQSPSGQLTAIGDFSASFPAPTPDAEGVHAGPVSWFVLVNQRFGAVKGTVSSPTETAETADSVSYMDTWIATTAGAQVDASDVLRTSIRAAMQAARQARA